MVSLVNSQDASVDSFPHQFTELNFETNLDGLAMGCRQPSKSDQVPDLNEKAYLTQKSQVPDLNETHFVQGKRQLQNDDSHFRILSNVLEEGHMLTVHLLTGKQTYTRYCLILLKANQKYTGEL